MDGLKGYDEWINDYQEPDEDFSDTAYEPEWEYPDLQNPTTEMP